ncbi:MAG: radical SAM protein [Deltaproteobacteria bacterium]|nr:radical SAM protein [Deltaproteobacteria bacterium]
MKVALVNIPDNGISGKGYSTPLGLAYIGAVVRRLGHEVKGFDLSSRKDSVNRYYLKIDNQFLNFLNEFNPDFVGMTCTTTNRINLNFWARVFKEALPNVKIMVGGPHPYFIPESYLRTNPEVDILVMGEGELTIVDYLKAVEEGRDIGTVKGVAFRDERGSVIINPLREAIKNLDEIPFPARDLFDMEGYDIKFGTIVGKTATIIATRGCGNNCKFCSTTRYWQKVRFRSAKNIVDEIEDILGEFPFIKNVVFFDDTFTLRKEHVVSVCREMIARKIVVNWACLSRTDVVDEELLTILKESGCTTLSFGIESGNDLMLKTMRKNSTVDNNYKALTLPLKHGITARGLMIAGMPEEKFGWAVDSLLFMADPRFRYQDLQISLQTFIFPGTWWERWFREKYTDFSWENMPERFKKGSFTDSFGNIVLPCYRWKGIHFFLLYTLRKLIKFRIIRSIVSYPLIQNMVRYIAYLVPKHYPKSLYDD